ncbi:hypothetical protein ABKW28_19380 [Nocardioides sp. 31GB23]|uniref:hypothetical protein n=1 Tax=Nocardioides sp. 31GB23 TaxID=3156065 RepID=UPI0032AF9D24
MEIQAHGLGGGSDLPIPASLAIGGGTAALTLSFVVLLLAWQKPRFAADSYWLPVPRRLTGVLDGVALATALRVIGMVFFAFVVWCALAGPDTLTNPTFGIVYVWLWVGLVPASLLFGRWYRALSPARTMCLLLARLLGPAWGARDYPKRWGYWPAGVALFAFVWMELVSRDATYLGQVRLWFAIYFAAMLVGTAAYGERWLERADPFEVYSTLVAHLSLWGRRNDGSLVIASPLRNLSRLAPEVGLVAVVAVLLGSTAYDSWRESAVWIRFVQSSSIHGTLLNTAMLLSWVLIVGIVFTIATSCTPVNPGLGLRRRDLPSRLAHSIVPIIVGYMIAHYISFLVESGQLVLIQISDPMGTGANLFGTADGSINYWLSQNPSFLASIKVLAIVIGHVLGVIAAHDRSLELLPRKHQITGQLPLLGVMVLYTFMGLYLLFGT